MCLKMVRTVLYITTYAAISRVYACRCGGSTASGVWCLILKAALLKAASNEADLCFYPLQKAFLALWEGQRENNAQRKLLRLGAPQHRGSSSSKYLGRKTTQQHVL